MRDKVKRFISILMTALMLVNLLPVGALAEGMKLDSNSVQSRASEPETVYETDTRTVYIYVRVVNATPEQQASWSQNKDKWYTMGSYTFGYDALPNATQTIYSDGYVQYNDIYNRYHKKYTRYIGVDVETITNGMTLNITNATIPLEKVTWYNGTDAGFKLEDGATDFTVDKAFAWHLDGQVDAKDVESNYKIHYVDLSGKQLVDDDTRSGKPGTQTKRVTANGKTIPGYTYVREDDPKTITVDGQTVINVYYKPDGATVSVTYTTDGNGTLAGSTEQTVGKLTGEPLTAVTATPASGYDFVGWYKGSDKIWDNPILDAATAKKNLNSKNNGYYTLYKATEFTAKFEPITAEVHYTKSGDGYINSVGNSSAEETFNVVDGDGVTGATAIEKENSDFVFVGWYKEDASGKPENLITTEKVLTAEDAKKNLNRDNNDLRTNTVYHAVFKKQKNLSYTVNYYWAGDTSTPIAESFHGTANLNTVITPETETETETVKKDISGYTFKNASPESITISSNENANVLNLYYYKNVTLTSASDEKVYDGEALTNSTVTAVGFVGDDKVTCDVTGSQTDADTSANRFTFMANNEINSKYKITTSFGSLTVTKRPVTLTSETASKPYDGTALTKPVVKIEGSFVEGEVTDVKATGSVTYVSDGEVTNTITYKTSDKFNEDNYAIEKKEGKLSITPVTDEVTVTITGHKDTQTYDGNLHTVTGYDVAISNEKYKATDFRFNGKNSVTQTNAGTYPMGLKAADFENTNTNFTNVTFKVTDGSLTISPRSVVLTSETASKPYDGTALTNGTVTVGGADGFADGEGATYDVTGTQTNVGKSKNTFSYKLKDNTKAENYTITTSEGTLEVTAATDEVVVTIKENAGTAKYDGTEKTVTGYTVTNISNKLYAEKDFTFNGKAEVKGTDAGTYDMALKASDFTNRNANFSKVTFVIEDGQLVIEKRKVTLTSGSGEKVYDGNALTNGEVTVSGDGFVKGEGATYEVTGTQTNVGKSNNTFTYTLNEGTKADNYTITTAEGELEVTPFTDKVTVTITEKSGIATYDGKEHFVSGYESMTANNPLYDVENYVDETPTAKWTAKGTNAGEYPVGIAAGDFENTNKNFSNVTFVVEDGSLTIAPAPITLQASSRSKTYDGTPLKADGYGFSEGNLDLAKDIASVILTGSQTLVGSSESQITEVVLEKEKNPDNYKFTFLPGTLTVTDGTGEDEKPVDPAKVITKTHTPKDTGYNLGETVTFTVSVTNIYNEQKEVTLEEQPGVTFVDPQGAAIGTKATKTLEPGEKWEIQATYTITLDDILADGFTNKVKANFKGGKNWNAEDYVETRDPYIELDVTKTADVDKAALGQTITYTITVDYQSNVPGKKVEVKDPLTGLETSFTTEEALEGKTVTFTTTYTVTEQDVKNGIVKNTATVKSELDNEWMPADVETPTFAPITIKPKDVTATYNGAAITGKDVEITSGKLLEGHKLSAAVIGSGVNAGSYELTLDPEKIKIVDANNKDVSEMYARTLLPGKLIINKRSVLITSQSATKTYDGSALTRPAVTITGDGFVPGELAKAEATGSITKVGSTPNTIQYTTTGAFNAANYSIALSVGTLTVTEKPKPEPRRTFNLTINYVYQNGKRAAASYNRGGLKNGETFDITSPVIAGYTASETVVSGTIYNRDIKVTVIYTADGVNLDDYGVPLGLGNITMNVGDCFE